MWPWIRLWQGWLMHKLRKGGYKAEGGIDFLRVVGRGFGASLTLDHPRFGRRIATVAGAISTASYSPQWARAHAHDPAAVPRPSPTIALNDGAPEPPPSSAAAAESPPLPPASTASPVEQVGLGLT